MLSCLLPGSLPAGNETDGFGPRSFSAGQISSLFRDVWAVQNNPGALGYLAGNAAAVSFERRYSTFSMMAFSAALKHRSWGTFGIGASRFGPEFFNQSRAGLSWGKSFGIASLGLRAQWYQVNAKDMASRHYLLLNFGGMAKLGEKMIFSGTVSNLSQTISSEYTGEKIPTVLKAGLGYQANSSLFIGGEVQKDLDEDAGVNACIEYLIQKDFTIRTGFSSATRSASMGLALGWRDLQVDAGSSWHPQLGFSHCIGLQYRLGKNEPEALKKAK